MNTSHKLAVVLTAASLLSAARVSAQTTYNWSATGGDFATATNWTPQAVPGAGDTAIIDDLFGGAHNQTVTYDIGTARALGTLNLLNGAGAGFINTLQLTSTTSGSNTTRLTIANALVLGTSAGTVEIRLSPSTTANASAALADAAGITVNTGGLITLDSTALATGAPIIFGNTTLGGGTLSILGNSTATAIGSSTANSPLTLNSGLITFNATNASSTGRLQVNGNFTTTGGSIAASAGANIIELYGTTNSIAGTTYNSPGTLTYSLRGTAAESLTSSVDLPNVLARNGQVNTVAVTSAGQNVGLISINTTASTIKLGSNMNTASLPSLAIAGATLDLNGNTLNVTNAGILTPTAGSAINSSLAGGTINVAQFNFGTGTTTLNTIGANVTIVATASPTGAANLTSQAGTATYSPTSTLVFTGNSTSGTTNRLILAAPNATTTSSVGNLVVGNGTSTTFLQLGTGPFNFQGNVSVYTGSTLDINGRPQTVAGKLQGTGIVNGGNAGGMLTFTGTGGLSPGLSGTNGTITGLGSVGTLTLTGTVVPVTLIGTSASIFDLASSTSFDILAANANAVTVNGTLTINLLNGFVPASGQTFAIITGTSATSSGTFSSITDALGDTYTFSFNGGTGTLTVTTVVPEPSTWAMVALALVALPARRVLRRRNARA